MMLIGKNITAPGDPLQPTEVEKVFQAIANDKGNVAVLVNRLRLIRAIDPNKYRKLKTGLPYLVCADFRPRIRKKENFLKTDRFILDLDHLSEFGFRPDVLRNKLKSDPRVELLFSSPGGDGLKVMFRLKSSISDSSYYTLFYKAFCVSWAKEHQLGAVLDSKTNDVTRCCFVSFDPEVYFNADAELINAESYLSQQGFFELDQVQKQVQEVEKENREKLREQEIFTGKPVSALTDDVLKEIKSRIGIRIRETPKKHYIQPEELKEIQEELSELVKDIGVELIKSKPINYGRQLKFSTGKHWAELNIFYGKKGVTVVKTTKTGSNKDLAEMLYGYLHNYFESS